MTTLVAPPNLAQVDKKPLFPFTAVQEKAQEGVIEGQAQFIANEMADLDAVVGRCLAMIRIYEEEGVIRWRFYDYF